MFLEKINKVRWFRRSGCNFDELVQCFRPDLESALEGYEPWVAYEEAIAGNEEPAYVALMEIGRSIDVSSGKMAITGELLEQARAWIATNGFLGVLQHVSTFAQLAPLNGADGDAVATRYVRHGATWSERNGKVGVSVPPVVMLHQRDTQDLCPIGEAWGPFFPDVSEQERECYQYPFPESSSFWKSYCEPFGEFFTLAYLLYDSVTTLAQLKGQRKLFLDAGLLEPIEVAPEKTLLGELRFNFPLSLDLLEEPPTEEKQKIDEQERNYGYIYDAFDSLNWLLGGTLQSIGVDDTGEYIPRWRGPSLISHLALMAVEDTLLGSAKVARCESSDCSRIYRKTKPTARYCSARCQKREQMRKYRADKKKLDRRRARAKKAAKKRST